ncbi:MAG: Txe/YoeB family addiction module toxin [Pyrinomonadaceae bacterium]|nr:Txe/YoeB family addiction module toxin [Pyrinomonadaceae bacterium]
MRKISFLFDAFEHYNFWATDNRKTYARINEIIKDIGRNPFSGIGKPELLRHDLKGLWSRRITDEHRLVYKVSD